ncbi:MAG TPA: helix-turn-helix domain-containing protein [Streptosporangiaceae bacterium]|nr:helix-turn-helix domain-containing protein [Streptosporangiaceae bacterium]
MDGLRPLHAPLLIWLLGGGRRAADLADGLRVSRQAVAQVVVTLEAGGYVERLPDPADRRAKLIWEARLGARRLAELRRTLTVLLDQRS